ncbi:hypothetical protein SAMN05444161_3557 [Rhizobiales bacterium GAS191]|nr:hypothetical protein SAMN05444161_3557 [Rhizobiales bacterium GAS191]
MSRHLTRAQQEMVVAATSRLHAHDRKPALNALRALLPRRPVTDKELKAALRLAVASETTNLRDNQGVIPVIRLSMTPQEATDAYQRTLDIPCSIKHRRIELTPQELSEAVKAYAKSLGDVPGQPVTHNIVGDSDDRRDNLERVAASPPVRRRLSVRAPEASTEPSPKVDAALVSDNPWSAPPIASRWVGRRRNLVFFR